MAKDSEKEELDENQTRYLIDKNKKRFIKDVSKITISVEQAEMLSELCNSYIKACKKYCTAFLQSTKLEAAIQINDSRDSIIQYIRVLDLKIDFVDEAMIDKLDSKHWVEKYREKFQKDNQSKNQFSFTK